MSVRLLKKVLNEQQQTVFQVDHDDNLEEEEDIDSGGPSRNPFDLLEADEDADYDQDLDDEGLHVIDDNAYEEKANKELPIENASSMGSLSSKKFKKKKKKKKKKEVTSAITDKAENSSLELELESISLDGKSADHQGSLNKGETTDDKLREKKSSILTVDPKFLNAENELRRIFGSRVVSSFESKSQAGSSRQVRGVRRGGAYSHRKSLLVSPSEHWPRWDGSFSMELVETRDGKNYFRYVHPPSYSQAQRAFEAAKAIHDLNGVASILMHHPYHVESLMTLADYFKFSGEHQMAADSIAKCLYALECAWHPMFTPLQDDCRLEYTHETNRPLFLTLFTHMKNLDRRGCHRSALEVCKLLLSLDPADPMGALFCVDYFSIRAGEYQWLEHFSEEYQSDDYLWHFPNFTFSLAICRYHLEREDSSRDNGMGNQKEAAIDLMKQALMLHPPVLKKFVEKVPLKDQAWKIILKHALFKSEETRIPSLDHLIRIYVERCYIIWRLPDLQKLLKDAAFSVIEAVDHDGSEAKTWACARKEAFPSDKNEFRHLLVSDFSDAVPTMPPENLQDFMIDPRMREMVMPNQNQQGAANHEGRASRELANRSPLLVLFESILPWVDYGDDGVGQRQEADRNNRHQEGDNN